MLKTLRLLPLLPLALMVGCQANTTTSPGTPRSTSTTSARERAEKKREEANEKGREAAERTREAAERTREAAADQAAALKAKQEEYRIKIQKELDDLDKRYNDYKVKVENAKGDTKVAMQKKLDELDAQRKKAHEKLKELGKESKSAWADLTQGMDNALKDLKDSFDKAKDNFK